MKDGAIHTGNGITIKKQNGQLLYDASVAEHNDHVSYNTILTPRGRPVRTHRGARGNRGSACHAAGRAFEERRGRHRRGDRRSTVGAGSPSYAESVRPVRQNVACGTWNRPQKMRKVLAKIRPSSGGSAFSREKSGLSASKGRSYMSTLGRGGARADA